MPAQAVVYVAAVITTVAAVVAFREFVYEPHIAPKVERWAENFLAKRQARRRQLAAAATASASGTEMRNVDQHGGGGGASTARTNLSASGEQQRSTANALNADRASFELEQLVAREVDEWRSQVDRSQARLRHRKTGNNSKSTLTQSGVSLDAVAPTHVIFDDSTPSTPTSPSVTGRLSPGPASSNITQPRRTFTNQSLRGPLRSPPGSTSARLPTPAPSSLGTSSPDLINASIEQPTPSARGPLDIEFMSASSASSRPESPFSDFSGSSTHSHSHYLSFVAPAPAAVPARLSPETPRGNAASFIGSGATAGRQSTVTSPFLDLGERPMMDMDFLSVSEEDMDEFLARSPAVSHVSITESELDGSDLSSWASASARGGNTR